MQIQLGVRDQLHWLYWLVITHRDSVYVVTLCLTTKNILFVQGSTNVGEQLPTGQLSVVPWRRTGVKYTNNEAYFDVVEEIDAIIDKSGILHQPASQTFHSTFVSGFK